MSGGSGGGDADALRAQVRFLEDNVRRLNEALSAQQLAAGGAAGGGGGGGAGTFLEGVAEGDPLPPWLVDAQYLSPLLVAYDRRLAAAEGADRAARADADRMRARIDEVVAENEALAAEAARATEALAAKTEVAEAAMPHENRELLERIDILTRENDSVLAQVSSLEEENGRLHATLEARAAENARMARELAGVKGRLEASSRRVAAAEREAGAAAGAVQRAAAADAAVVTSAGAAVDAQRKFAEQSEAYLSEIRALQSESSALTARCREAEAAAEASRREAAAAREACTSRERELEVSRKEATDLAARTSALEQSVADYQARDVEVFQRVKEALDRSEGAHAALRCSSARAHRICRALTLVARVRTVRVARRGQASPRCRAHGEGRA